MFHAIFDEPVSVPCIAREDENENYGQIHEVAVDILDDEREIFFAEITFARLADGAIRGVGPKCFVIGATIIIAGETKSARSPQNKKRAGKNQPVRPPRRFAEPRMR